MKFVALIPARYASTRFPGKPLARLGGKPVIQHVYEKASCSFDDAYVCTDDQRIYDVVTSFGGKAVMTSPNHKSGTDRCYEAYLNVGSDADVIVNIQGDEPFVHPSQLKAIKECFEDASTQIATLVKPFSPTDGLQSLKNSNSPKVVVDANGMAMYFSRSVIPYLRGVDEEAWLTSHVFFKHIGLYAYKSDVLKQITSLPQGVLEKLESLEQLRWLENGYKIKVATTDIETIGIDTPEDLVRAEHYLASIAL